MKKKGLVLLMKLQHSNHFHNITHKNKDIFYGTIISRRTLPVTGGTGLKSHTNSCCAFLPWGSMSPHIYYPFWAYNWAISCWFKPLEKAPQVLGIERKARSVKVIRDCFMEKVKLFLILEDWVAFGLDKMCKNNLRNQVQIKDQFTKSGQFQNSRRGQQNCSSQSDEHNLWWEPVQNPSSASAQIGIKLNFLFFSIFESIPSNILQINKDSDFWYYILKRIQ